MLQIRLSNKGSLPEGSAAAKPLPSESGITVACPDHLILADLPVAKSLGNTSSATLAGAALVKTVGRRSRRQLGERVHFCVRCDFPIAIYGRLSPCEHAFCLACARMDSSCYLCDERIQKIQTIKMMEGILICAAPHCLKSFLKRSEFESHIHETHADLLHPNTEREEGNDAEPPNSTRPPSLDPHTKQMAPHDSSSTARSQPRPVMPPNSNPYPPDREDRARRPHLRDQLPQNPKPLPLPLPQPKPPFFARPPNQPLESHPDNNLHQGFDRPYNRFQPHQPFETQGGSRRDHDKQPGTLPESSFPDYPPHHPQPPSFSALKNPIKGPSPTPPFSYPPFPILPDGALPFSNSNYEVPRPDLSQEGVPSEHGSLLGFPPMAPTGVAGFPEGYPRPWSMAMPFEVLPVGLEGYPNPADSQGRVPFFQGDYHRAPVGFPAGPLMGNKAMEQGWDNKEGKGVLAPLPLPLHPPLPPPLSQLKRGKFTSPSGSSEADREGPDYGWQSDKRGGYGSSQD